MEIYVNLNKCFSNLNQLIESVVVKPSILSLNCSVCFECRVLVSTLSLFFSLFLLFLRSKKPPRCRQIVPSCCTRLLFDNHTQRNVLILSARWSTACIHQLSLALVRTLLREFLFWAGVEHQRRSRRGLISGHNDNMGYCPIPPRNNVTGSDRGCAGGGWWNPVTIIIIMTGGCKSVSKGFGIALLTICTGAYELRYM